MPSQARFRVLAIEGRSCARHVSSYRIDGRYRAAIPPDVQQRPSNPAMVRSPARSLRLQFSERYTGQSTVPLPIAGQGSNRAEGPTRRRRRSRPLPGAPGWPERSTSAPPLLTVGITHRPLLAAGSSPADSRGPSACCRSATGRRVLGADPSKRPSARRPPGWRVNLPTAVQLVQAPPHTAAHPSRCAVPATAPGLLAQRHPRTTARGNVRRHHRYPVAPHRHRTGSTRTAWRSACPAPTATPGPHCPTPTCQAPTSRGCRRHRDDRDHRRPTRPCRRR